MNFGLTDEQEMIVSTVRAFVEREIYPHEDAVERTGIVPDDVANAIRQKTIDLGFYACNFPESAGGAGLSHLEFALVERELGRGSMALTHFFGRPQNILMACRDDQVERYLLPAAQAIDTDKAFDDPAMQARYEALIDEVRCLVCQNQTIKDSNAFLATDLRREIRRLMSEGQSDEEIADFLVARYGEFVLYRPRMRGKTLALWLAPLALLVIGGLVVVRVIRGRADLPIEDEGDQAPV